MKQRKAKLEYYSIQNLMCPIKSLELEFDHLTYLGVDLKSPITGDTGVLFSLLRCSKYDKIKHSN